mgnify:CR=1 FL=1
MAEQAVIEIKGLQKKYDDTVVLKDITEDVKQGEVICVIGPSGACISTFLPFLNLLHNLPTGLMSYDGSFLTNLNE